MYLKVIELRSVAYLQGWLRTRRLDRPVLCVGNLTVGGTGKTPVVIKVAKTLLAAGHCPCILTRGYGRRGGRAPVALDPGADLIFEPRTVGDEPAALARALPGVPIVVSADRFRGGIIGEQFHPTVYLLDDGFQHLALYRDLDVILIDVTRPWSEYALLPAGRAREPFSAIRRAHWVILTRTEPGDPSPIEAKVRAVHSGARIFHCSTKLTGVAEAQTGLNQPIECLHGKKAVAFCAIGNPAGFFADLRRWGFDVACERSFRDHHAYTQSDLASLADAAKGTGAQAMITTEKDVMNLPRGWDLPLPVYACCIQAEIEEKMEFEQALAADLERARRAP